MSRTIAKYQRIDCAWCGKNVAIDPSGKLYWHNASTNTECRGARRTPKQVDTNNNWRVFLQNHWRIGDAIPVHYAMLNTNPPAALAEQYVYLSPDVPHGLTVEEELFYLQLHARDYIDHMCRLLYGVPVSEL